MRKPREGKVAVFIDGSNLYATAKTLGVDVDYSKLPDYFGTPLRLFYYTAVRAEEEYSSIRPLLDYLHYNGYCVREKPVKTFIDNTGRTKIKGNMDIEIAVDMLEMAEVCDELVLFSGDGDFRCLVDAVQRKGCHVTVVSTIATQPPMIADELRRQTDTFLDLAHIIKDIGKRRAS